MCILLINNLRAVADNGERVWYIRLYLHAIFVATSMGEVSEIEIFLRFDGVPELELAWSSMIYFRAPACNSPFSLAFVHFLFVDSHSRARAEVLFLVTC